MPSPRYHMPSDEGEPPWWDEDDQLYPISCPACDGYGKQGRRITIYEHGCGFGHDDVEEWDCDECEGTGKVLAPYEPPTDE